MKKAIKSNNQINAFINKNFVIRVLIVGEQKTRLTSANKLSTFNIDDQTKTRLFNKLIDTGVDKHTFKIRNRLKIDFCSK